MEEVIINKKKRPRKSNCSVVENTEDKQETLDIDSQLAILCDISQTKGTGDKIVIPLAIERIKSIELHNKLEIHKQVKQKLADNFGL